MTLTIVPVPAQRFIIAVHSTCSTQRVSAAVIYVSDAVEPSFSYVLGGRQHTSYLFQRKDVLPSGLYPAINDHIKQTAISWARVLAHPTCPAEVVMTLAIARAVEKWSCRQTARLDLTQAQVLLPTRKRLTHLPEELFQVTHSKDAWLVAAARIMCWHPPTTHIAL